MSLKTNTFRKIIGRPLNTHNFVVMIPALADVQILVSGTTFPTEVLGTKKLFYQGEPINYHTYPNRGGTWQCSLSESEYAKVFQSASLEYQMHFSQALGMLSSITSEDKFNMLVGIRPLSDNRPVTGGLSEFGIGTSVFSATMQGCFLLGMSPVNLSHSTVTTSWVWGLTFSYDSVLYNPALPNFNTRGVVDLPVVPVVENISLGANELKKQGKFRVQRSFDFNTLSDLQSDSNNDLIVR